MNNDNVLSILKNFDIRGKVISIDTFGNGHINRTYRIKTDVEKYILQEINSYAFKDIKSLMNNIEIVTSFIRNKGENSLEIIHTLDGQSYVYQEGKYYRVFIFIDNTICYETIGEDLSLASKLGEAFGKFHCLLSGLDSKLIKETIKDFHNTPQRFKNFLDAYSSADKNKITKAKKEIDFIINYQQTYSLIVDEMKAGNVKTRITHNDTKINNVLFDKKTKEVFCIIDLDTIMPGSVLYDIGDSFRGLFTGENEDNRDLSLQKVNINVFYAFIKSYLLQMKDELTKKEIELIPYSIYLMVMEVGMRFLEDYLRGNIYFHVEYEEHNLVRAKTQIALAEDVLLHMSDLTNTVNKVLKEIHYE